MNSGVILRSPAERNNCAHHQASRAARREISDYRSRFILEPLEPGFGYTLGNSLRRTLLSSIPGAAVTSIKVDGVQHEFSTIEGVKEDVTEIILNVKSLVVSIDGDDVATAYIHRTGPGLVTAADIQLPAGVEVHNPDLVLASLDDRGQLEMELTIEAGRGYVSARRRPVMPASRSVASPSTRSTRRCSR